MHPDPASVTPQTRLCGSRLMQTGAVLFLLALVVGLFIPLFKLPRVALSAHLLGLLQGMFLIIIGMAWDRLTLSDRMSVALFWLLLYGCFAAWGGNLAAAIWGAGGSLLPARDRRHAGHSGGRVANSGGPAKRRRFPHRGCLARHPGTRTRKATLVLGTTSLHAVGPAA